MMQLTPPWVGVALVNGTTYLFDQRVMDALADALPGASPQDIADAVEAYLLANPVSISSTEITDSTAVGRNVLTASTQADARTAIGAGTSNLAIGTTGSTAKAGDYQPDASNVTNLAESVRDTMGAALVAGANVTITVNDAGDTITIAAAGGGGGGAVDSVNGETGVVVLNQDEVLDGTTAKQYTQTEKTKLAGIATGATANQSDATTNAAIALKANAASPVFTGTTQAPTPTNGDNTTKIATTAFVQAALSALAGVYAPLASPAFTGTPTGITKAHVGLGNVDNTADSAKPVSTAQAAADTAVQAAAIQRGNHTGTQSADTLTDGTTNKAFLATERTKLAGIATGATVNSTDATLLARGNHTGTQTASTISDFGTAADARVNALVPAASETAQGKVELATTTEAGTGTDTARAVTPAGLAARETAQNVIKGDATILRVVKVTQAAYDALTPPVSTTLYVIVG
jgi:hypothetical protein